MSACPRCFSAASPRGAFSVCAECRVAITRDGREIPIPVGFEVVRSSTEGTTGYREVEPSGMQVVSCAWRPRWGWTALIAIPWSAMAIAWGLMGLACGTARAPLGGLVGAPPMLVGLAGLYLAVAVLGNQTYVEITRSIVRRRDAPLRWRARREIARADGDAVAVVSRQHRRSESESGPARLISFDVVFAQASGEHVVLFAHIPSERHALAVCAILRESLAPR